MRVPPPTKEGRGAEVDGKLPSVHWDADGIATIKRYLDVPRRAHHMYGWISLARDRRAEGGRCEKRSDAAKVIGEFKDHPAIGGYKASDEPAWGHVPLDTVVREYQVIHEADPESSGKLVLHAPPKFTADVISALHAWL